jgi:hypothetical protein
MAERGRLLGNRDDEFPKPNGGSQMTTIPLPEAGDGRAAFLEVAKGTEKSIGFVLGKVGLSGEPVRKLLMGSSTCSSAPSLSMS